MKLTHVGQKGYGVWQGSVERLTSGFASV